MFDNMSRFLKPGQSDIYINKFNLLLHVLF
jgi:hypothetical protein